MTKAARRTFHSLRYRNYRLFFGGQIVSQTGSWMQRIALGWFVLQLTHSAFDVGVMAFAQFAGQAEERRAEAVGHRHRIELLLRCMRHSLTRLAKCVTRLTISLQDLGEELLRPLVFGLLEEVLGRSLLDDQPVVHHHDPVGRLAREAHLVSHDDHGRPGGRELLHH